MNENTQETLKPDDGQQPKSSAQVAGYDVGLWPKDCLQRAFVNGAKWWQYHHNGSTMFGSERDEAEKEAVRRYGEPKS